MKILYYDCFAGISGDMNLGALIDLGADRGHLVRELAKLEIGLYRIDFERDQRRGITGIRADVVVPAEDSAGHHHGHGNHRHTSFSDIRRMIQESGLSGGVKEISLRIFTRVAEAEAKIHGHAVDEVAFHEVGAVDSIVDIVGAAVCLESLNVQGVLASPVQVGGGFVKCEHGMLPVPAPATAEILKGIPIRSGLVPFETTTPTGAAILAATVDRFVERLDFVPSRIGYGIGRRDTEIPNVLRIFLGEAQDRASDSDLELRGACLLETNIDDMSPETYDSILESLFEKGAQDVYLTPIIMKKSRPAVKISILCDMEHMPGIEEVLWFQTTTFGLRFHSVTKVMLPRDASDVLTRFGKVSMKNAYFRGKRIKSKAEYEDCKRLAGEKGVSVKEVYDSLSRERET